MKVLVTCTHLLRDLEAHRADFAAHGLEPVPAHVPGQHLEGDELVAQLDGCVGVVAGDDQFSRDVLERAPALRAVAKWGIGVDGIDQVAAEQLGIRVSNTPGMFDDEVGDVAIAYVIMLARQLHVIDRGVRAGEWPKPPGMSLRGRTLGVVGFGGIGRATAARGLAIGMDVVAVDPSPLAAAGARAMGVQLLPLDLALPRADVLALHCPLTADTHHLLDADAFARLRPGALLVNLARGPVVDERALVEALRSGRLAAAALDVFEDEPLPAESPLRDLPQLVLGSHNASNTHEAATRTHRAAIANLAADLRGRVRSAA